MFKRVGILILWSSNSDTEKTVFIRHQFLTLLRVNGKKPHENKTKSKTGKTRKIESGKKQIDHKANLISKLTVFSNQFSLDWLAKLA